MGLAVWDDTLKRHVDWSEPRSATGVILDVLDAVVIELGARTGLSLTLDQGGNTYNGVGMVEFSLDGGVTWTGVGTALYHAEASSPGAAWVAGLQSSLFAGGAVQHLLVAVPPGATHARVIEYGGSGGGALSVRMTVVNGGQEWFGAQAPLAHGGNSSSLRVLPALLNCRGNITTSEAVYSAGDCIGGKVSTAPAIEPEAHAMVRGITLKDDKNQKPGLQVLFFRSSPAGTYTDNSPVAPTTADMQQLMGIVSIAAADWVTIQGTTKAVVSKELQLPVGTGSDLYLHFVLVATTTPDYAAGSSDLSFAIMLQQQAKYVPGQL